MMIWLLALMGSIRRRRKPSVDRCRDLAVCLRFDSRLLRTADASRRAKRRSHARRTPQLGRLMR